MKTIALLLFMQNSDSMSKCINCDRTSKDKKTLNYRSLSSLAHASDFFSVWGVVAVRCGFRYKCFVEEYSRIKFCLVLTDDGVTTPTN
jgi:hypothetical protein